MTAVKYSGRDKSKHFMPYGDHWQRHDLIVEQLSSQTEYQFILNMKIECVVSAWIFEPNKCYHCFIDYDDESGKYTFSDAITEFRQSNRLMTKHEWMVLFWEEMKLSLEKAEDEINNGIT